MGIEVNGNNSPAPPSFLSGGGELGALMRQTDWSATPLGPPELWPLSLKTAVRIVLTARQPMFIWWGPDLINLYNDPYRSILGGKHPAALGQPASSVWKDIWDQVGPRSQSVLSGDEGTYDEALLLIMHRNGYPEETYFTFSYSPLPNDQGVTSGIFCANSDDTQRIIGARQLALQREIAARVADSRTAEDACAGVMNALATNLSDLPFSLLYLVDEDRRHAVLAGTSGIEMVYPWAPQSIPIHADSHWPLEKVLATHSPQLVSLNPQPHSPFPSGAWDRLPNQAFALPINTSGQAGRPAILIAALSPYRLFDDAYRGFLELLGSQIAAALSNAQAYQQERKRAEALAELDRAKTAFFSNVSHEFRTPLTLMLGPIEDLLSEGAAEFSLDKRELLSLVHRNGLRLQKLVNALLEFSRIEAGRVLAQFEPTDLAAFTTDLVAGFRSAMTRAQLEFTFDCPPLSKPVYIDRGMWERIVLNLLSNALKYTLQGSVSVRLSEQDGLVQLAVSDTGTGIPASEQPHLFERFHRVESARARTFEGTGIGLALVYELTKLHSGTVAVVSQVDIGSTFTVTLPFAPANLPQKSDAPPNEQGPTGYANAYLQEALAWLPKEEAPQNPLDRPAAAATVPKAPRSRILLAEDNADMRQYVGRLLSQDYDVIPARNGAEALRTAIEQRPDLIVSDIMMPELDGFGLLRGLRSNVVTASIPVLFLSARAGEEASAEGREAGADDYIVKPFTARELLSRVRGTLLSHRERQLATRYLNDIFSQAPIAIAVLRGRDMIFEFTNQAYEHLIRGRQLIGRSMFEVVPELRADVWTALQTVLDTSEPYVANDWFIPYDADGDGVLEEHWFNLVFQPFRQTGAPASGVIIVANEITVQVRSRAELEQANRQLEEFAYVASHDLQEPLRMVNSYSQLLVKRFETQPSEQARIYIQYIDSGVRRMQNLIQDLLSFARVVQSDLPPGRPVDLSVSLAKALEVLQPQSQEKQARISVDSLPVVLADDLHIDQLFQNLLSNALKYSRSGVPPHIRLSAARAGEHWIVSVSDNGIGFKQEYAEHVFGLFKRLHRNEYPGTGLGLAICKRIVERSGGRIWAESEVGKGSTFYFSLPAVQ